MRGIDSLCASGLMTGGGQLIVGGADEGGEVVADVVGEESVSN